MTDALQGIDPGQMWLVGLAVGLVVLFAVVFIGWLWWRPRRSTTSLARDDLDIDVATLPQQKPPEEGEQLQVYGTPVRVALVVLAPAGRHGLPPTPQAAGQLLDALIPGMGTMCERDRPEVRVWHRQLSRQGFAQSFFNHVALPGDRGRGSRWCSVAGHFQRHQQSLLLGIVFVAAGDNGLGQMSLEHEGQWLDVVRVTRSG